MRSLIELVNKVVDDYNEAVDAFKAVSKDDGNLYRKMWKRMKKREIADGYPRATPLTKAEADAYMREKDSVCLLCGRKGRATAGSHLVSLHQIDPEEYSLAYHLPLGFGLICPGTKEILSNNSLQNEKFIECRERLGPIAREKAMKAIPGAYAARKGLPTYHGNQAAMNGSLAPKTESPFEEVDFLRVLNLMTANDLTYSEVYSAYQNIPSPSVFYEWQKEPMNKEKYESAVEGLSFAAQVRAQKLGKRFDDAAKIALAVHATYRSAAESLGVSEMTLRNHVLGIKRGKGGK